VTRIGQLQKAVNRDGHGRRAYNVASHCDVQVSNVS
jgi:hypothetical protein